MQRTVIVLVILTVAVVNDRHLQTLETLSRPKDRTPAGTIGYE